MANLAVFLLSWLVSRAGALPEGYAAISAQALLSAQFLLLGIYAVSAATRTLIQRHPFTLLEIGQTLTALLIGIAGAASMASGHPRATLVLGLFALAGGLACYVLAFVVAGLEILRNFRAWATFGMLLVLAGTFLLSASGYWMLWCGCAAACCAIALAAHRPTLGLHGAVYLLLGSLASGAAGQPLSQFFGLAGAGPLWPAVALVVASALLAWVAVVKSSPGDTARWRKQVSSFTLAAIITWIAAGAATHALVRIWPGGGVPADTLGTVVLTLLSVALAWSGIRWEKRELVWLVYVFMGLSAWKLAARDFQREHNLTLVVSLLAYGGTLILLPRILQRTRP